jgi:methylglutaconyl-CoA hydratase
LIEMLLALDRLTKPTIAVVQGAAVGGGLAVALCCDVAFAYDSAFFSIPEVRIGLMPGPLVPLFLRAMPYRSFRRYGLSGERFSSTDAKSLGLIHDIAATDTIEAMLAKQIEEFLAGAPNAIAGLKLLSAKLAPPAFTPELLHALGSEVTPSPHEAGRGRGPLRSNGRVRCLSTAPTYLTLPPTSPCPLRPEGQRGSAA